MSADLVSSENSLALSHENSSAGGPAEQDQEVDLGTPHDDGERRERSPKPHLNNFVYEAIAASALPKPDIDVPLVRHFAQCAEDVIVVALLQSLAQERGLELWRERYLEIGANHPIATSATYLLREELGMRGVLVEANPALIDDLKAARPGDTIIHSAVVPKDGDTTELFVSNNSELTSLSRSFVENWAGGTVGLKKVETVPAIRMNALLEQRFAVQAPIFLSVDVEGLDLELLKDVDWDRWRPLIVQAEPSEQFIADNARQIAGFMKSRGYVPLARTPVNQIFLDRRALRTDLRHANSPVSDRSKNNDVAALSVGVVMRTKDRAVLLRRALESVKSQSHANWQLVIVNDGGDEAPVDWLVGQIFQHDERVTVIHHAESRGMEAASNAGLAILNTEYAVIHDDDDSWAPEFMSSMTAAITRQRQRFASIRGIACRVNAVFENVVSNEIIIERVKPWKSSHSDSLEEGFLSIQKMLVRNQFPPIAFMFELESARAAGLFDESLPVLGDWDFHTRFLLKYDIWVHAEYLSFYHHREAAKGALGNTVHAGAHLHRLYGQKIRNDRIRAAAGQDGCNLMLMMIPMEVQEHTQNEIGDVLWKLRHIGDENRPSSIKRMLVSLWDSLPPRVQKGIEPFADWVDRVVK
ncbi:MAG: glycosyltransferase [Aestuariivirga sp.]|uniref:glycosyltransferase n=1 Tax=Aestuariivirga sp. TaxID=2650926 RepID=UPI0025C308C2|nr:glycosyltransferase [Aestuariivirga sp.]MCA3559675.1 glycosyltransferase [Aestuariivirga sp.]